MYMDENNWLPTENFRWSIMTGLGIGYYLVFWRKEDTALFMTFFPTNDGFPDMEDMLW
jgi:hypothetical protein